MWGRAYIQWWPPRPLPLSQSKLNQFEHVGGVLESSGRADFKTVPGFAFRATFEVDIEGFTPVKVMVATTVL